MLNQYSEIERSKFVIWTQPSGPLCLWQCLFLEDISIKTGTQGTSEIGIRHLYILHIDFDFRPVRFLVHKNPTRTYCAPETLNCKQGKFLLNASPKYKNCQTHNKNLNFRLSVHIKHVCFYGQKLYFLMSLNWSK